MAKEVRAVEETAAFRWELKQAIKSLVAKAGWSRRDGCVPLGIETCQSTLAHDVTFKVEETAAFRWELKHPAWASIHRSVEQSKRRLRSAGN